MVFIGVVALGRDQRLDSTQGWVCLFREKEQPQQQFGLKSSLFLSTTPSPEQPLRGWKGRKAPGAAQNLWGHDESAGWDRPF